MEKLAFARDCARLVAEFAPALVAELDAVAAASQLNRALLEALVFTLGEGPACSVIAIAGQHTVSGGGLFGRNFDFFDWDLPFQQLYDTYPTETPGHWASAGCTGVPVGREDGVNEAGLVMAQTHASWAAPDIGVGSAALSAGLEHDLDQARGDAAALRKACLRWCATTLVQQQPHTTEEQTVMRQAKQGDLNGLRPAATRGFRRALM